MKRSKIFYITATIGLLLGVAAIALITLAVGWAVSLLWNYVLVQQGLSAIDMYQGAALLVLMQLLIPTPRKRFTELTKGVTSVGKITEDELAGTNTTNRRGNA